MSTNVINEVMIPYDTLVDIAKEYITDKVNELLPKHYDNLIKRVKAAKENNRYWYIGYSDTYYDFLTGNIFSNPYTPKNNVNKTLKSLVESKLYIPKEYSTRCVYPKSDSNKLYVDSKRNISGNGKLWKTAFKKITQALSVAQDGDEIIVAEGTYDETIHLKSGVSIYGGYKNGEENLWNNEIGDTVVANVQFDNSEGIILSHFSITNQLTIKDSKNISLYKLKINNHKYYNIVTINNSQVDFYFLDFSDNHIICNTYANDNKTDQLIYIDDSSSVIFFYSYFKNNLIENTNTGGLASEYTSGYSRRYFELYSAIMLTGKPTYFECKFNNNNYSRNYYDGAGTSGRNFCGTTLTLEHIELKSPNLSENEIETIKNKYSQFLETINIPSENSEEELLKKLIDLNLIDISEVPDENSFLYSNFTFKDGFNKENIIKSLLYNYYTSKLFSLDLSLNKVIEHIKNKELDIPKDRIEEFFLNVDAIKTGGTPYDKKLITDINRGHWDLWEDNQQGDTEIKLKDGIIARNPEEDVNYAGLVAIDFGTKSTVVVYQKNDDVTYIKRIGTGNLKKEISSKDYENPTVLQFINIERFIKDYNSKDGRPLTRWDDVTSSYTALNRMLEDTSDDFNSYFYGLKQWTISNKKKKIIDKNKKMYEINSYLNLNEEDILDPIEIYAYYIGNAINNMNGDGIFIDYILSFPVKYNKEICKKICNSFEKGLKKSLPQSLLNNEDIMKKFKVRIGATEPAAYAVCALQEYGFEPEGTEEISYGVFDFGGGTTDFDFGVWREPKSGSYDFEIEHFYDNGDKYLGGENILQLLAFEIFKNEQNQEVLKNNDITFLLPPESIAYPGSESLISESQEAELNTKKLMEECRYFWEHNGESFIDKDNDKENYTSNTLIISLYSRNGESCNCELYVDETCLKNLIISRIDKGVENFFASLKIAFDNLSEIETINIFLAGNSSQSKFVTDSFKKHIEDLNLTNIKMFPPLGTEEAKTIQQDTGKSLYAELVEPNGKTGVAYGLIRSRESGKVRVIKKESNSFKYYIGIEKRRKFKLIIDRDTEFNKWIEFMAADRKEFEIYYTDLPMCKNGDFLTKDAKKIVCEVNEVNEDKSIYVRILSNTQIQYTIANENEIKQQDAIKDSYTINL